jgi:DNA polymerase III sliding clamp (beta) subunit (PCNA family)
MQFASNQAKFAFGGMEFVTKLVEGKFPDYNRVIPKNHKNAVTLGRAPLLASLQRTAILTSEKFKGVRLNIEPARCAWPATTPSRKRRWTSSTSTTAATTSRSAST